MSAITILATAGAIAVLFFAGRKARQVKRIQVFLHRALFPFLTFYVTMLLFVLISRPGSTVFWLLVIPALICASVADSRMRREGERHLRLRGFLSVPKDKQMVPKDQFLLIKWAMLDSFDPAWGPTRSPAVWVYQPGDLYDPETKLREAEFIWLSPGEHRVISARRSPFARVREHVYTNRKGRLKVERKHQAT
jgi:hypothetical protein